MNLEQIEKTGLTANDWHNIMTSAQRFPQVDQLVLFGSRAMGNYKIESDVDLAIKGQSISYQTAIRLSEQLNEVLPLPYFFDVVNYADVQEPELVAHIDRVGVIIFNRAKLI
jgi:predicted nucleotidyltransferase